MVVLAPGGPPMSRRVYLSHLDMPKGDFRYWPLTAAVANECRGSFGGQSGHPGLIGPRQFMTHRVISPPSIDAYSTTTILYSAVQLGQRNANGAGFFIVTN